MRERLSLFCTGHYILWELPRCSSGKEPACQCWRHQRPGFSPWVGKIPWRRAWQPTPVFFPGESHGQRSPVGYSLQGHTELDTTEATQHTCVTFCGLSDGSVAKNSPANAGDMGLSPGPGRSPREENGNPLQYSCLGSSKDREACHKKIGYDLVTKQHYLLCTVMQLCSLNAFISLYQGHYNSDS